LSFLFWYWDQTQGLAHARQVLYHQVTSQPYFHTLILNSKFSEKYGKAIEVILQICSGIEGQEYTTIVEDRKLGEKEVTFFHARM
jgi:hypothetical protein